MSPRCRKVTKNYHSVLVAVLVGLLLYLTTADTLAFGVRINGVQVDLPTGPVLKGGVVMLPLSCLLQPLGIVAEFDGDGAPVVLRLDDKKVVFSMDSPEAMRDGQSFDLRITPYMKQNEIMVPLNQLLIDGLGIRVDFDSERGVCFIGGDAQTPLEAVDTLSQSEGEHKAETVSETVENTEPSLEEVTGSQLAEENHGEMEIEVGASATSSGDGLHPLAIGRYLEEMLHGTTAKADEKVPGNAQGPRLVGVIPVIEDGRQRLDFITDAKVEVMPMLLVDPARLVLDVEDAVVDAIDDELYVGQGVIHRVRLSQYDEKTARAVVDLVEPTGYQIRELRDRNGFSVIFNQRVGRVDLFRSGSNVRLRMEVSGPVRYTVSTLNGPRRLLVDIENATCVGGKAEVRVHDSVVESLRISQYTPTETRIVMDLKQPLEVADVDAATNEDEIGLVFLDPQWGRSPGPTSRNDSGDGVGQGGKLVPFSVVQQLATLGRELLHLVSSNKVLAMGVTLVPDMLTSPRSRDDEHPQEPLGTPERTSDGVGSSSGIPGSFSGQSLAGVGVLRAGQNLGQIRFEGFDDDYPEQSEDPSRYQPFYSSSGASLPVSSRYGGVDLTKWPDLRTNWIEADALSALKGRSILIDAGHGGFQPGAPGVKGIWEKTYNLELALRVGELLQWAGARVSYTRVQDQTVSLRERVDKVKMANAEIFVSIHGNASLARDAIGTETLYHPAIQENRSLAEAIQENLVQQLGLPDRGIKQRPDLYILRHSPVASALVEVGFLDHPEEGAFLLTSEAIDKASMGLVRGIAAFFRDKPVLPRPLDKAIPPELQPEQVEDGLEARGNTEGESTTPGEDRGSEDSSRPDDGPLSDRPTGSDTLEERL